MAIVRGVVCSALLILSLAFWGALFLFVTLAKLFVIPFDRPRSAVVSALVRVAEQWVTTNNLIFGALLDTVWDVEGLSGLQRDRRYLIVCNHQSWADIVVLLSIFHNRIPFIRFFLKQELIWLPIAGQACWALEFPFMKRYTPEYLAAHPEKRGADLATTRKACRRYRSIPVAVLNFVEGTRFTREKHEEQASPFKHLLRPRTGGVAYVVASLGEQLASVLDVTIIYPEVEPDFWKLISGQIARVVVRVRHIDLPPEFVDEAVTQPGEKRDAFKLWIDQIWRQKDELIEQQSASSTGRSATT